jgi:hypothetical protein
MICIIGLNILIPCILYIYSESIVSFIYNILFEDEQISEYEKLTTEEKYLIKYIPKYNIMVEKDINNHKKYYPGDKICIMETTPNHGIVIMRYDSKNKRFIYYSDKTIPYNILDTVCLKFVTTYHCVHLIHVDSSICMATYKDFIIRVNGEPNDETTAADGCDITGCDTDKCCGKNDIVSVSNIVDKVNANNLKCNILDGTNEKTEKPLFYIKNKNGIVKNSVDKNSVDKNSVDKNERIPEEDNKIYNVYTKNGCIKDFNILNKQIYTQHQIKSIKQLSYKDFIKQKQNTHT